jgi:hypothetical protein
MTLSDRQQIAEVLVKIVQREYVRAHGVPALVRRGLRALAEQAQQMGLAPEDLLTDNGRDAFVSIARVVFAPYRPQPPRDSLNAEWQTVIRFAA